MGLGSFDPVTFSQALDVVNLAGIDTPGRAEIGEWKRVNDYDVKVGKGTAGATITLKGQPPAKGSIKFYAWRPDHFARWDTILPLLRWDPAKDKNKQAIGIFHPLLDDIGVSAVMPPESIGSWQHEGGLMFSRTIEFLEFVQPQAANIATTPAGATDAAKPPDPAAFVGTGAEGAGSAQAGNTGGAAADAQGVMGAPGP
jgi:hypothetical protein